MSITLIVLSLLLRRRRLLRPANTPVLSWEKLSFRVDPLAVQRIGCAVRRGAEGTAEADHLQGHPGGRRRPGHAPVRSILPFVVITATLSTATLVGEFTTLAVGYVGLCLFGALVYAVVSLSVCLLHAVEVARMAAHHRPLC
jgi:cellulose synthase (UDP-forming)